MVARRPLLLLTRPEHASQAFWRALPRATRESVELLINPLLTIHATGPLPPLDGVAGLIFTSAHALDAYCALGGTRTDLPVIAVGEGTAAAARTLGFRVDVAGGTADHVVAHILDRGYKGPLIHMRGEVSVGDVAGRLTQAGVPTTDAVLYEQRLEWLSTKSREALSQDRAIIAPVFSARTAHRLAGESKGLSAFAYVAISEAVADALPAEAKPRIRIAKMPNRDAMLASVTEMVGEVVALERGKGPL